MAYIINRDETIVDLRKKLKQKEKQLSIGEIDKIIYITVLYKSNVEMMKISDKYLFPISTCDIYYIIYNSFLSEKSKYDSKHN